ncbi:hypothetical protein [Nitrospina gracilis]|uniref:hypothetical protein n=1 Tax=Nitrospina gracilis TaxID=35801 RepID=UPI001F48DAB2|nr:hypothetical protein [Nitrospina gracilis]MCF8720945.1 hypothetical protein [Nitrospina gracilis Nb-211]
MKPHSQRLRIPLMRLARGPVLLDNMKEPMEGLELVTSIDIFPTEPLPGECYALKMEDDAAAPHAPAGSVGVFCQQSAGVPVLHQIYLVQIKNERPRVCKLVKSDSAFHRRTDETKTSSSTPERLRQRRKSFMTPTPLHIPDARVSPIPDSAHEMVYLKNPEEGGPMLVLPSRDVLWMHPLVFIPPS